MPVSEESVLHIVCDNPACPGNSLPVDDKAGWSFVDVEVHGTGVAHAVYCSAGCVSADADALLVKTVPASPEPLP